MCGIVGIAGDLWYKEEKTMQRLFLLDYFRGPDSTGLAAVGMGGQVKVAKIASDPITLFQSAKFKDALNGNMSKVFIGHNRAATRGAVNNWNAHPFHHGHIVGVHNGTLSASDKKTLEEITGEKFDVDSEALIAAIAKVGIKEAISSIHEGADHTEGAWALVWYDQTENSLNFLRNKHRPLWFAYDKGFKRLFFASQWQMLDHMAEISDPRYELERYEYKDKPGQFYRFMSAPENVHLRFDVDLLKKGSDSKPKPKASEVKGKEPVKASYTTTGNLYDPFQRHQTGCGVHTSASSSTSSKGSTSSTTQYHSSKSRNGEDADKVVHIFGSEKHPYAGVLTDFRFIELTQGGCSWCTEDIHYGDGGIIVYDRQDTILCKKCAYGETSAPVPALKFYDEPEHFRKHYPELKVPNNAVSA